MAAQDEVTADQGPRNGPDAVDAVRKVDARDVSGSTSLIRAATKGHLDMVNLLLERGADPNAVDANSWTALFWAVHRGHVAVVKPLIARGASINIRDPGGRSPLQVAQMEGQTEIHQLLEAAGGKY